jgi:exopolysaccharide biosynthesis WecB/TagA/CpsF family protein
MKILGIDFYGGNVNGVVQALKRGGMLVVPAAPGLARIEHDLGYYAALKSADIVIPDSGYMVLIWNLTHKEKIHRISGLEFLSAFFSDKSIQKSSDIFLVDPTPREADANQRFLRGCGFMIARERSYVAPVYDPQLVEDLRLVEILEAKRPQNIIINLGGGVQEKLGAYLKTKLTYRPAIICTGAAIAFLTGEQARIPKWADRYYMGWFFRCLYRPKLFIPRYTRAFSLLFLMWNHGKGVQTRF